jgi:hypothetical protein
MRVVHLSDNLMSAAPYRLAQVQRLAGIDARVVTKWRVTNQGPNERAYPHDLLNEAPTEVLRPILEGADIVHYHHRWRDGHLFEVHPWAWAVLADKPGLMQFHVPRADAAWVEDVLRNPAVVKLVVAQYHVRQYPECIPVQNAVPIDDEFHRPLHVHNEPPVIAFTPPDCRSGGWWHKGCAETRRVLADGFRYRFVTDASWWEAMRLRQGCDIAIDEVVTGSYHMCSLEALSQGLATVTGLDELTVDALERVTGTRRHPWVVANLDTLRRRLDELVADPDYRQAKREEARAYMVRYWHPAALAEKVQAIYAMVLERHG